MSEPVPWGRIPPLLERIKIGRVGQGMRVPLSYAGFSTESLLRAQLLPYLVPLKSERALAFELAERPELQIAVGITNEKIPSRATLWHFRDRNLDFFRRLMIRSIAVIAVEAVRDGLSLPFIVDADLKNAAATCTEEFDDPETKAHILVYTQPAMRRQKTQTSLLLPLPGFPEPAVQEDHNEKMWLHQVLDFPIFLQWRIGRPRDSRYLVQPSWLNSPYAARDLGPYFGKAGKLPYTACNVIVLRHEHGRDEILMSRRLTGSGAGTYAVPGGKKKDNESIIACVRRELKEEVGIDYRVGKPISDRVTHEPGYPLVRSVGVVATEWSGKPARKEHLIHSDWKWYQVDNLPSPLFFPTQLAIDDFLDKTFDGLEWTTVEPEEPLSLWSE